MTDPNEFIEKADNKPKVFTLLAAAAAVFFRVAMAERAKDSPGPAQAASVLVEDGKAHICISIQMSNTEMKAGLSLVAPKFVDVLDHYELKLNGPIAAAFANPDTLKIIDLGKLN